MSTIPPSPPTLRRLVVAALTAALAVGALAQGTLPPPPQLEPLPEPPPLPPGAVEPGLEPQITIVQRAGETIEEHRIGGRLYMIKVTPRDGVPYYLIDDTGDGRFLRREPGDNLRVPMWVLFSW